MFKKCVSLVLCGFFLSFSLGGVKTSAQTIKRVYTFENGRTTWQIPVKTQRMLRKSLLRRYKTPHISGNLQTSVVVPAKEKATTPEVLMTDLLRSINAERSKKGVGMLRFDDDLTMVSNAYSKKMMQQRFFSHKSPEGIYVEDRLKQNGINFALFGENLARGQKTVSQVMNDWKGSKSHWDNFMSPYYSHIGIGISATDGNKNAENGYYWTVTMVAYEDNH